MNPIDPSAYIKFHNLLLEEDEYDLLRFLASVKQTWGHLPQTFRKPIVWTMKLRLLNLLAILLQIFTAYGVSRLVESILPSFSPVAFLVLAIGLCYVYFIFLGMATLIFYPFDGMAKIFIIRQAKQKIRQFPDLKIIGVAGSYGKTLMKEMLAAVLSEKFHVLKTPKNINTPLGIARLIQHKLTDKTQILIVEMGEYLPGDIRNLCRITPPDIGVITGINEAHLERMGTIDNTIGTIFELADEVKSRGLVVLNADDERVVSSAASHLLNKTVRWYGSKPSDMIPYRVKNYMFRPDGSGISFDICEKNKTLIKTTLPLLAQYVIGDVIAAVEVARNVGLSWGEIGKGIAKVIPPPHRLQPIRNETAGILVIDDSYNGNPDGVGEAIRVLHQFTGHRKIYITPGLVEMGSRTRDVHVKIGKDLAPVADLVILIKNSVTPYIADGLAADGFAKEKIIWYPTATECHKSFFQYVKPNDVVLFQNDWPDNYV
jgi:UDP-N-acetylmuramoyl-tripeptide--D-alanyl-D-alanine ligase